MRTDEIIQNLKYTAKKHENDKVFTGQLNITSMCKDILPKMEQLKAYEDAEEQGLILRLPCKVGDTVYWLSDFYVFGNNYSVTEEVVEEISITEDGLLIDMSSVGIKLGHIGKDVFLTKEEAEQKLAEMKGE